MKGAEIKGYRLQNKRDHIGYRLQNRKRLQLTGYKTLNKAHKYLDLTQLTNRCTVIRFVGINAKFGICTAGRLNGRLVEAKLRA